MITIRDRNGNEVVAISDALFPLKFDAYTIYGKKRYKVNITYCPDIDPMAANTKIKSVHLSLDLEPKS
jgi:hypothetical protein